MTEKKIKTLPVVELPAETQQVHNWSSFWAFLQTPPGQEAIGIVKKYFVNAWINNLIDSVKTLAIVGGVLWFTYFLVINKIIDTNTYSTLIGTIIGYVLSNHFKKD